MQRRSVLRRAAAVGAAGAVGSTAGCLTGAFESEPTNVVLGEPEDQLADSEDLSYPAYGQSFPAFTLPEAFSDEPFSSADRDRPAVYTAFYAFCTAECLLLMGGMANVQATLAERDRLEAVDFVGITFDPTRDTPAKLEADAEQAGIRHDHERWHYLRPESDERAEEVVDDLLGIGFEKTGGGETYEFTHITITFLVNPDGVVERAYRGESLDVERVVNDLETVVDADA